MATENNNSNPLKTPMTKTQLAGAGCGTLIFLVVIFFYLMGDEFLGNTSSNNNATSPAPEKPALIDPKSAIMDFALTVPGIMQFKFGMSKEQVQKAAPDYSFTPKENPYGEELWSTHDLKFGDLTSVSAEFGFIDNMLMRVRMLLPMEYKNAVEEQIHSKYGGDTHYYLVQGISIKETNKSKFLLTYEVPEYSTILEQRGNQQKSASLDLSKNL